jgi:hypothetical protein
MASRSVRWDIGIFCDGANLADGRYHEKIFVGVVLRFTLPVDNQALSQMTSLYTLHQGIFIATRAS